MQGRILYLDSSRSKAVFRALRRFGRVDYAPDINEALCLIAETDYDYYFIDADVPDARPLIKHLRHDPDLFVPRAMVLLTENEDEDCDAWMVDSYVNTGRVSEDVPYIFSHFKAEERKPASVLRIATLEPDAAARSADRSRAGKTRSPAGDEPPRGNERTAAAAFDISADPRVRMRLGRKPFLVAACLVLIAGCVWLFSLGPLGVKRGADSKGRDGKVEAETNRPATGKSTKHGVAPPSGDASTAPRSPAPIVYPPQSSPAPVAPEAATDGVQEKHVDDPGPVALSPAPSNPAARVNHAPAVSISGPTLVTVGQTVTFYAHASDQDGDSVSYSWGGPSRSTAFQNTGSYHVSVSVTDSGGLSASATLVVTVRQ